jgi:stage II sporulation protein D
MRPSLRSKIIAMLVAPALLASQLAVAQDASQQTRPRRAQGASERASPTTTTPASSAPVVTTTARLSAEPTIRIGLATDVRSVNISTNGRQLQATPENAVAATPISATRVRIESRSLAPTQFPAESTTFRVEVSGAATRVDADRAARDIRARTNEAPETAFDAVTNTWRIRVGAGLTRAQAESLRARLRDAGFASASIVNEPGAQGSVARAASSGTGAAAPPSSPPLARRIGSNNVRPVSRTSVPSRELVVYASGASVIFNSRAPVTFASDDERSAPVRFNEKPYRGRLEVFPNAGGGLTVVNVVGLEDYVRGVVPNELSPGGYPAIEALKAQAIAARTYAVKNRDNFADQGFDLLPTTRSQVYGGLSTEHPLSSRAVEETRGIIATYKGEPINALYTSTCGGRTENSENIFNAAEPYLRGRECSIEGKAHFAPFTIKTSREPADIREEQNAQLARDTALLAIHGFPLPSTRITDAWLSASASAADVRGWLSTVARLSRQNAPVVSDDATRPSGFSTALASAVYGTGRADTLLDNADVDYILAFRDASDVPAQNRADVALLLRDGYLSLYPDATLRPREPMPRARMLHAISRLLEERKTFLLQVGTTRPSTGGALVLRSGKRDQSIAVSADAYLFRAFGEGVYQMRSVAIVGGEPVTFHVNTSGQVDYLEVSPAQSGASAERFSPFTNWTSELSTGTAQSRLARWSGGIGSLTDLRIAARGSSRRVTDLEIVGTNGTAHLRGGRIRSALGLREQLFVIDRRFDATGRVIAFVFTGRGWGHGVGMCQVGAYGLARAGLSYDKILKAYYSGIELTKLY